MKMVMMVQWMAFVSFFAGSLFARPILAINEDNDHYFKLSSEKMTREALVGYIDSMAKGNVTHLFLCPSGQRTSYDSSVWEPIWMGLGENGGNGKPENNIWCVNAKRLFDQGIDPYAVWVDRCREKGISPWITMRMNDIHFCTVPKYFRNTTFWRTRSDLWRVPHYKGGDWMSYAFDYAQPEVRAYHLKLAKEQIARWKIDGFEMDWLRFPEHLRPGRELQDGVWITDFVRQVRRYADEIGKRRGRKIRIGVRVASRPDVARAKGTDAVAWAKEGLIDWITTSDFWSSVDFDVDLRAWKEALGTGTLSRVTLIPGVGDGLTSGPVPRMAMNLDFYRGWADIQYGRGAEGIYFFNLPYLQKHCEWVSRNGLSPTVVAAGTRRYPVTYHDVSATGFPEGRQFPIGLRAGGNFVVHVGPAAMLYEKRRGYQMVFWCDREEVTLFVKLNGVRLPAAVRQQKKVTPRAYTEYVISVPSGLAPLTLRNQVTIHPGGDGHVVWSEIRQVVK